MSLKFKIHWCIWNILVFLVTSGTIVFLVSGTPDVAEISLNPNETINVPTFRVLSGAPLKIALEFNQETNQQRPELGEFRGDNSRGDWQRTGKLEFRFPGEPIKLLVRGASREIIYEATPAIHEGVRLKNLRELVPFVDDENPNAFQWPPDTALAPSLNSGRTTLSFAVVEVGKSLAGERVSLVIIPPITYSSVAPQYGFLIWFAFWPLYVLFLIGHGFLLLWLSSSRWNKNVPTIDSKEASHRSPLMAAIAVMTIFITIIYLCNDLAYADFRTHLPGGGLFWIIEHFIMYLVLLVSALGLWAQKSWSRFGYLAYSTVTTVVWLSSLIVGHHGNITISRLLFSSAMLAILWGVVALIFRYFHAQSNSAT